MGYPMGEVEAAQVSDQFHEFLKPRGYPLKDRWKLPIVR